MKRIYAYLYFPLLCVWPFISFKAININEPINDTRLLLYSGSMLLLAVVLTSLLKLFFWRISWRRLGAIISVMVPIIFSFLAIRNSLWYFGLTRVRDPYIAWGIISLAAITIVWAFSVRPIFLQSLSIIATVMVAIPIVQIGAHTFFSGDKSGSSPAESSWVVSQTLVRAPNIYYFILDGYGCADIFKRLYGFDNSPFLRELKKRGFFIADRSNSNYDSTNASKPSTLLGRYLNYPEDKATAMLTRAGEYPFVEAVKTFGYKYIHYANPNAVRCIYVKSGDCLEMNILLSDMEANLLKLTPFGPPFYNLYIENVLKPILGRYTRLRMGGWGGMGVPFLRRHLASFKDRKPFFLFGHIMSPHPPYMWDRNCNPRRPRNYTLGDYDSWKNTKAYVDQLQCLNRWLLSFIDEALAQGENAIIVLHGDHGGSSLGYHKAPPKTWIEEHVVERHAILNALRLPKECRRRLTPRLTPVNNLRIVLDCITGKESRLLKNRFFTTGSRYNAVEWVERLLAGCGKTLFRTF